MKWRGERRSVTSVVGVKTGHVLPANWLPDEPFYRGELGVLFGRGQRDGITLPTGSSGAPDPVDVVLGHMRKIKVDHVADAVHIEPPSGDVGRDEGVQVTSPEPRERSGSCVLALVTMDGGNPPAGILQAPHQLIGARLCAGEHQGRPHVGPLQQHLEEGPSSEPSIQDEPPVERR